MSGRNLNSKLCGVIQYNDFESGRVVPIGRLKEYCCLTGATYFYILHDCDRNDDGSVKTLHYHVVLDFGNSRRGSLAVVRDLARFMEIPDCLISMETCSNICGAIRYLVHADDPAKHQYDYSFIDTNDKLLLDEYFSCQKDLTVTSLIRIVEENRFDAIAIMRRIGLTNYMRYRYVIQDIIRANTGCRGSY